MSTVRKEWVPWKSELVALAHALAFVKALQHRLVLGRCAAASLSLEREQLDSLLQVN